MLKKTHGTAMPVPGGDGIAAESHSIDSTLAVGKNAEEPRTNSVNAPAAPARESQVNEVPMTMPGKRDDAAAKSVLPLKSAEIEKANSVVIAELNEAKWAEMERLARLAQCD